MMDSDKFMRLANRVEAATGPDRELDAEIAPVAGFRVVDEGHPLGMQCYDSEHRSVRLPAYTRSIDDAMALVPDGCAIEFCITLRTHAAVFIREEWQMSNAATPALALTAAALRARARAMEGE